MSENRVPREYIEVRFEYQWPWWRAWVVDTRDDSWLHPGEFETFIRAFTFHNVKRLAAVWVEKYLDPPAHAWEGVPADVLLRWYDADRHASIVP